MHIQHKEEEGRGSFVINKNDKVVAEMTYTLPSRGKIIIDHTEVDDVLRGKNVGNELVDYAVDYARKKGLKVIPVCPFVKAVFDKKGRIRDVLSHDLCVSIVLKC